MGPESKHMMTVFRYQPPPCFRNQVSMFLFGWFLWTPESGPHSVAGVSRASQRSSQRVQCLNVCNA